MATHKRSYKSPFKKGIEQVVDENKDQGSSVVEEKVNDGTNLNSKSLISKLKKELKRRLSGEEALPIDAIEKKPRGRKRVNLDPKDRSEAPEEESDVEPTSEQELRAEEELARQLDEAEYKLRYETLILTEETLIKFPYREGPLTAKIVFVGEAAGSEELAHEFHRPFIGSSGIEFRRMLNHIGITPEQCYITNLIKDHPADNDFDAYVREHPNRYAFFLKVLAAELALLKNAKIIVPIGAKALRAICGKDSIENWRGSIIPARIAGSEGKKCIPIIHPAAILRQWLYRPATILDLKRIKEESTFSEIKLPERKYIIRPDFNTVVEKLQEFKDSKELLSVDTETVPGRIVSIQLCISPHEAIAIPFQYKNGTSYWSEDQEVLIWGMLASLLENCGKRIIGQNFLTYDLFMLAVHGINWEKVLANVYIDTMESFQCLQPQLPKGLDFLTSIYTREPYYKSEGKEWGTRQGEDEFWTYGCKDVLVVHEIAPQIYQELVEEKQLDFYNEKYQSMAHERMSMTLDGIKIDIAKREELKKKFMHDIIEAQCRLNVLADKNINVKSFKQMSDLLYVTMKLPKQYKNKKVTTDEDAILALSAKNPSEIFTHIIKTRQLRTLYSNNLQTRLDSDQRFRSSFGYTITGRFTSYSCPFNTGGNLQNWTPDMRVILVPDSPDLCFIEGDLSQADARVVFWRARDEDMINAFLSGVDIHVRNATLIFEITVDKVTKEIRYTAKKIVHACNYDMQAPRFAQVYNKDAAEQGFPLIGIKTAGAFIDKYHSAVPNLKNVYHKELQEIVSTTKTIVNPFGRSMVFHDRIGHELFKQVYACYAQSTVADLINIIFRRVSKSLRVKLQVHDALLVQCKKDERMDVIQELRKASQVPIEIEGKSLIIPMEFKMGDPGVSWKDLKKVA